MGSRRPILPQYDDQIEDEVTISRRVDWFLFLRFLLLFWLCFSFSKGCYLGWKWGLLSWSREEVGRGTLCLPLLLRLYVPLLYLLDSQVTTSWTFPSWTFVLFVFFPPSTPSSLTVNKFTGLVSCLFYLFIYFLLKFCCHRRRHHYYCCCHRRCCCCCHRCLLLVLFLLLLLSAICSFVFIASLLANSQFW